MGNRSHTSEAQVVIIDCYHKLAIRVIQNSMVNPFLYKPCKKDIRNKHHTH